MKQFLAGFGLATAGYIALVSANIAYDPFIENSSFSDDKLEQIAKERAVARHQENKLPVNISVYNETKLGYPGMKFGGLIGAAEGHKYTKNRGITFTELNPSVTLQDYHIYRVCIQNVIMDSGPSGDINITAAFSLLAPAQGKLLSLLGDETEKKFLVENNSKLLAMFHTSSSSPTTYKQLLTADNYKTDFTISAEKQEIYDLLSLMRQYGNQAGPELCSDDVNPQKIPLWDELVNEIWS